MNELYGKKLRFYPDGERPSFGQSELQGHESPQWAMQMEPEEEFKPQPESYWTEWYERLFDLTAEFVPEKRN